MPIRTNTPGTGIFIGSGLLGRLVADERSGGGGRLFDATWITDFRYTPATHWVFGVQVPYTFDRRLDQDGLGESSTSGLGDMVLSGKVRFYREVGPWSDRHAAVELDVKLPTGATDEPVDRRLPVALPRQLQPGTGSTDLLLDVVYQQARRRRVFATDLSYRYNTEGDGDYRFGNQVRLNLDLERIVLPIDYKTPGNELFVLLEGTLLHKRADEHRGRAIRSTRKTEFLLAPGVQYTATEQLLFSASLQLPVASDVGRGGLESDWNALVEFRYAF